jgi:hypothetical protein
MMHGTINVKVFISGLCTIYFDDVTTKILSFGKGVGGGEAAVSQQPF